jgi:hypothetical protein
VLGLEGGGDIALVERGGRMKKTHRTIWMGLYDVGANSIVYLCGISLTTTAKIEVGSN